MHIRMLNLYELIEFSLAQDWSCVDHDKLGLSSGTFTFISEAHGCRRWLDHCVVDVNVKYDVYWSDHFPLVVRCNLDVIKQKAMLQHFIPNKISWGQRNAERTNAYREFCDNELKNLDFPLQCMKCCDRCSSDLRHRNIISKMYYDVVNVMSRAVSSTYGNNKRKSVKFVVGWNKYVRKAHARAKLHFNTWL